MTTDPEGVTSECSLWRGPQVSSRREHLRGCERCQARLGRWMATGPLGERLVALSAAGVGRVEVRRAAGLCWVLVGRRVLADKRLEAVVEDEAQALDLADRLWAWLLTPNPPRVRVRRGPEGTYRLEAGGEVVDRHPDPRRLAAEALRLEAQLRAERPDGAREG